MTGMQISHGGQIDDTALIDLYLKTFTQAANADEGATVAGLVRDMLATTSDGNMHVFQGHMGNTLVAAVIFTRLSYPEDKQTAFILSPMAVDTSHQKMGLGQSLIRASLKLLHHTGVDVVLSYGDPAYYDRVGFHQITSDDAQPPLPLSMPVGWIGQTLPDGKRPNLTGPSHCVAALNRPEVW